MTRWGYASIAEDITRQINAELLKPGDPLPSRRELAEQYEVSEATIANALRHLAATGYTTGAQGKAVYVAQRGATQ